MVSKSTGRQLWRVLGEVEALGLQKDASIQDLFRINSEGTPRTFHLPRDGFKTSCIVYTYIGGPGAILHLISISLQELPGDGEPEAPMEDSKVRFFRDSLPFFIVWQNLAVRKMQKVCCRMG